MGHIGHNGAPAATKGTFADFKLVKTRGVAQLVIEVPIEQAGEALEALGGLPTGSNERWVALARLNAGSTPAPAAKPSRKWEDMTPAQQAGVLCEDEAFRQFLDGLPWPDFVRGHAAREWADNLNKYYGCYVCWHCGVQSRRDLDPITNPQAVAKWQALARDYFAFKNSPPIEAYAGDLAR